MRRLGPLLAIVMLASVLAPLSADAGPVAAQKRRGGEPAAVFNVPNPWGTDSQNSNIVRRIERAINGVPGPTKKRPKPTITVASYLLDRSVSVTALINACKRGVGIRVVLDRDIVSGNSRRLISALNGDNVTDRNRDGKPDRKPATGRCGRPKPKHGNGKLDTRLGRRTVTGGDDLQLLTRQAARDSLDIPTGDNITWGRDRSYVKKCRGSCRNAGKGGNMHSKFYMFSRTAGVNKVVMVSSSNLNRGGMKAGWNDMYVMKNRPRTYKFYLQVHRAMTRQLRAGKGVLSIHDGPFTSRFFPIRKAGQRNDPTLRDLKQIKCTSAIGRTEIRVSMFYWKGNRGNYLATQLLDLARRGCLVSAIYGAPSRQIAERLRNAAKANLINLFDSRWDFNEDGYNEVRTHAKYVLVKGTYRGDRSAWVVMTGTPNWVGGSLSLGDENSLNIELRSAYRRYLNNWMVIRNHSRELPYN